MKPSNLVRISIVFFAFCLPALGQPLSASGPHKWFHSKHPEKSNPHYKDGSHRHASNSHHAAKRKRP
jgi:hypothetical protein